MAKTTEEDLQCESLEDDEDEDEDEDVLDDENL